MPGEPPAEAGHGAVMAALTGDPQPAACGVIVQKTVMSRVHEPITSPSGIGTARRALILAAAALAFSASACGSDSGDTGGPTGTVGSVAGSSASTAATGAASPSTTAATPTKTSPAGGGSTTTTPPAREGTGEVPGGDERGNRVPVSFTVTARAVTPATVSVLPFLGIELRVRSGDGAAHVLTLRTPGAVRVRVPASGTVSRRVGGQRDGRYKVDVDGASARATLIVGDTAVGP